MSKYLVTFPNIFEHALFKEHLEDYFDNALNYQIKHFNSKFCEIKPKQVNFFKHSILKKACPEVKIVFVTTRNGITHYIEL